LAGEIGDTGRTVDQLTASELRENGILPVAKSLEVDLALAGYNQAQKVEGTAMRHA
jgi:hypothetical protein